jgi:TM2 domain-containing membrane protein YozV
MKTAKKLFVFGVLVSMFLSSCTMQKCVYSKGYYVDWFGNKSNGAVNKHSLAEQSTSTSLNVSRGQEELTARIQEVDEVNGNSEMDFLMASNEESIIVVQSPSMVTASKLSAAKLALQANQFLKNEITEVKAEAPVMAKPNGGKSQLTALLICIFVGGLGIHRFYLGYTGIGIIQLLTLGGCGLWALIDLIMIITGDLKPNGGEYDKTL